MSAGGALQGSLADYMPELLAVVKDHGVVLAYLYGSQARESAGPLSDIDVAVLFSPEIQATERRKRLPLLIAQLMRVFRRDDVFVADLADASPLLRNEVRREGQVLYCPDDAVRVEFEVRTFREFVDTEPLRRIRKQYLLARIGRGDMGRYPGLRR